MKTRIPVFSVLPSIILAAALTLPASAQLLVYEPFQYFDAAATRTGSDLLHNQPDNDVGDSFPDVDATGLGGTWIDSIDPGNSSTDLFMASGSLSFADLATSGNHVRGDTNLNSDIMSRPITADLDAGTDLWFSFLASQLDTRSAAQEGIVIGNQVVNSAQIPADNASTGLAGFGVGSPGGGDWEAFAWDGSTEFTVGGTISGGATVRLLVGHISFNTGTGGADVYTLYHYDLTKSGGSIVDGIGNLTAIGSPIEVDVDEAALDTLSLTRQVNTAFDEIRMGQTLADVIGLGADTTAPLLAAVDPVDDSTDVLVSSDLVATFNENVVLTGSGSVTIKNLDDGTGTSDITISLPDGQVTEANDLQIVINPSSDLDASTNYAVRISGDAVEDPAGNAFGGISGDSTWNFQTAADGTAPGIASLDPADDSTGVAIDADFIATFDETVQLTGSGSVTVKDLTNATSEVINLPDPRVTVSGNELTISLNVPLLALSEHTILISADAVTDTTGNPFAGILADGDWSFTTATETTPPSLLSTIPADDATDVPVSVILTATFDEDIAVGSGNITLRNLTDGAGADVTIDVQDASQVSVSGTELKIDPAALLLDSKDYAVRIDATAIEDLNGNAFAGIANDVDWSFSTGVTPSGLFVYEPFAYADPSVPDGLQGQPDDPGVTDTNATGLDLVWDDALGVSTGNLFLKSGSLAFGDLLTTGNHVGSNTNDNEDIFHRPLTTNAQLGIGGNAEIWFSVLADKLQNDFSAAQGGLVIANQVLVDSRVVENDGTNGLIGFGVAPTSAGNNWTAYAWNGSAQVAGDASLGVSVGGGDVRLLVGRISFDTGTGGADEFTLYEYQLSGSNTVAGGSLSQIASTLEVDVDQSQLDTLNLTRRVNTNYDEIRIGTTLADVVPGGGGGGGNSFADWIAGFDVGAETGFNQDPDGDGIDNGVEAFFGTAPDEFSAGISQVAAGSGTLTFIHPEADPPLADVTGSYEWSLDLSTWHASGETVSGTTVTIGASQDTPSAGTTTVTATITGTEPGRVFVRAVATQS